MILPTPFYLKIFGALLALLALTWGLGYVDLGEWNLPIALAISIAKAVLIMLFFMHVKYSSRLVQLVACAGFFWLLILLVMAMSDYRSRNWIPTHRPDLVYKQPAQGEIPPRL